MHLYSANVTHCLMVGSQHLTLFGFSGGGGGGWQKVPPLTLNVNNFSNIEANATKRSEFSFPKFIWQQFVMTYLDPSNLTFPWQPYFDRHVL